jgi:O-antigen/teichoic acid export membrane protein
VSSAAPRVSTPQRAAVLGSWRAPQHRDGMALVLSSALTSGIGLLFWVLAARLFDQTTVGLNSTVVSAMTLLGTAAQLNLGNAMLRFIPVAGRGTRALVAGCYAVGIGAAAAAGAVFALGAPLWAPDLVAAFGQSALLAFFVISTPIGTMFVMQDYVLPAIKRAVAVPVENFVFSVLKLVLLAGAAAVGIAGGIAVSWTAATALVVVGITVYLLRVLPPGAPRAPVERAAVTARDIATFVRADYAGTVFWQAALFGLPLVVLARLGAEAAATYNMVWQIGYALYLVANGMGQSLVAHVAAAPARLDAARDGMVSKAMTLLVPTVIVVSPCSYLLLSIFGTEYAEEGASLLVLLLVSAVPNVVTASAVWAARVRRDGRVLFGLPAAISTVVIAGSWVLMPVMGVLGVGVAWLVAQTVAAAVVLLLRPGPGRRRVEQPAAPASLEATQPIPRPISR